MKIHAKNLAGEYTGPSHSLGFSEKEQTNEWLTQSIIWFFFSITEPFLTFKTTITMNLTL